MILNEIRKVKYYLLDYKGIPMLKLCLQEEIYPMRPPCNLDPFVRRIREE